ncbi:hypothetical protein [Psychrobacter sp. GP33]|uniref:hypothetical protein n=1 Tax=Psychrobacter sp. GP33 TaxID=2758709 RepID=UPI002175697A|nr:hypothetical protein [Psychrobacter sp. GP33]
MLQLNSFNPLSSISKQSNHLLKGLMVSALLLLSFTSVTSYANNNKPPSPILRAEAANPANFKFISVNGRAATYSSAPCPVEKGLFTCALGKLALINSNTNEIDTDYDLAQSFIFPSKSQPKTAVVVVTRSDLMDDSVRAERYRISFKLKNQQTNPEWHWVQYGVQYQCARGKNAGKWTKNLCP